MMHMDEKRKSRYLDKVSSLKRYSELLDQWFESSDLGDCKKNGDYQKIFAIYHAAQLSIEVITDLCAMIVKDLKFNPNNNYSNFEVLYQEKIISAGLFNALKELNGLRNRIVHDYNGIIDEIAWKSILKNLTSITVFREVVESWLKRQ